MKILIKIPQIEDILVLCFFVANLLGFLNIYNLFVYNILMLGIGMFSIVYVVWYRYNKTMLYIFIGACIYTLFWGLSFIYNGNSDFVEVMWPIAFWGIGLLFVYFNISSSLTKWMLIIYIGFITILIVIYGGADNIGGSSSRNTISVMIVLFLSMHMIASYKERKSISIVYAILAAVGCFLGIGRSGILLVVLIMIFFICFSYENGISKRRNLWLLFWSVFAILLFAIVTYSLFPHLFMDAIENFLWRGTGSRRITIWKDYLGKINTNPFDLFLGSRIGGTYELDYYHENMHNSFLMLHAKYGLCGVLFVLVMLIKTVRVLIKEKNMYLITPLCLLLFRMNFDYTNFNGVLDIIMVYYLFYWGVYRKKDTELLELAFEDIIKHQGMFSRK